MSTLNKSVFSFLYSIPYLSNDLDMINNFTIVFFFITIINTLNSIRSPLPYGRYSTNNSESTWIPALKSRTGWMISFAPVPIIALLIVLTTPCKNLGNPYNLLTLISFVIHYTNRFLYSMKISEYAKPFSAGIVLQLLPGAAANAFFQSHDLANVHESTPSPLAYIGMLFVVTGLAINIHHDNILLNLRKPVANTKQTTSNEKTGYKIPNGGLFEYISCANYFGEIVEWIGFALISRGSLQFVHAMWSGTFLGIRALQHHEFYLKTFSTKYPSNRKAIIPFIL